MANVVAEAIEIVNMRAASETDDGFELSEMLRVLPERMHAEWLRSGERKRWRWLDESIRQANGLTADERDDRLEQMGGAATAVRARERALLDFRSRMELEARHKKLADDLAAAEKAASGAK
jgi:hypothetical protein